MATGAVEGQAVHSVNEAIAEVMFGEGQAGKPVYALPNDDQLRGIAAAAGVDTKDPERWLVKSVRDRMHAIPNDPFARTGLGPRFAGHLDSPPHLPVLLVLSLAAGAMRATDDTAAHNYYARLFELLKVPAPAQNSWQNSYRNHAEEMWGALNAWLESWEGERGVPTAYSLGEHRYVGLAMSQALVREADRQKLPRFFTSEALPPGFRLGVADMEAILDPWMARNPPYFSHSMRTLWSSSLARESISAASCLELESWDGSGAPGDLIDLNQGPLKVRLLAQLRTFPTTNVTLDLLFPGTVSTGLETVFVDSEEGPIPLPTSPSVASSRRLRDPSSVHSGSLLSDVLRINSESGDYQSERLPRRVVPLRFDELQNAYVEVERVQLAEQTLLFVADAATFRVEQLLHAVARPGFTRMAGGTAGVPDGWNAYRDVQVLDRYQGTIHNDLQPLLPRASSGISLTGGFVIPGLVRKWSSLEPPEIHAKAADANSITVRIHRGSRVEELLFEVTVEGSVAVIPLTESKLPDGEFLVTLHPEGQKRPSASSLVRLRSSDTPASEGRRSSSGLVFSPCSGPLWPLTASQSDGGPNIDGVRVDSPAINVTQHDMPPAHPRTSRPQEKPQRSTVRIGRGLGANSCMATGMHRYVIPDARGGPPVSRSVEGECTTCGQVKRFPTTPAGARLKSKKATVARPIDLSTIPHLGHANPEDLSTAFDSLCHMGRGTIAQLARVCGQVDGSSLFADVVLRRLEALGHIDVMRDNRSLSPQEWEFTPATFVALPESRWWLTGRQSRVQRNLVADFAADQGLGVEVTQDQGILRFELAGDRARLEEVLSLTALEVGDIAIADDVATSLAGALPPLSQASTGLIRVAAPPPRDVERWDEESATWIASRTLESVGAFRLGTYSRTYFVRDGSDLDEGSIALANVYLAKHLANLWAGIPLAGYHGESQSVVVPFGADLPGLYGRALCTASGRLPRELQKARMIQYRGISPDLAALVHSRLAT